MNRTECITILKQQNLNLIPLKKNDKVPLISWAEYQSKKYEGDIPEDANVGVVCGTVSDNTVVIDIDISDTRLIDKILPNAITRTLVVRTGKGYHIYVKTKKLPNTLRLQNHICHIDIQSNGTYIVAPTSIHPNGSTYDVISETTKIEIIDFQAIVENLEKLGFKPNQSNLQIGEIEKNGVSEGSRNDSMFRLACRYIDELDEQTAFATLETVNEKNSPPLDKKELRTIFESAKKYAKKVENNSKTKSPNILRLQKKAKGWVGEYFVESILVDSKPYFLCFDKSSKKLEYRESIDTEIYTLIPLGKDECGYFPYSFTSSEINELINTEISKEELLDSIKTIIDQFISLRELDKHLILGDTLLSYCLEWISTLHFPFFVGETESGKSTVLHLAKWLCYRCHLGEDIPMADVYNYLGSDEEGCGTIAEDEAQELWKNSEKIRMYKSSYAKGSKKARIVGVDSLGKHQVYYNTFCPKWFAGEKVPQDKGFLERMPIIHMTEGMPQSNIKRLSNDEVDQLNRLRNRILVWKVQNMNKGLARTDSGLTQRDQELWEDFLSVVNGTKFFDKCKNVVSYYTEQRHQAIKNSLEARLFGILVSKISENLELKFEDYWKFLTENNPELPGKLDDRTRKTFYAEEFNLKITPQVLARIFSDKFQATKKQTRTRNEHGTQSQVTTYLFNGDTLLMLAKKYGIELSIDNPAYVGALGSQGSQEGVNQVDHVNQPTSRNQILEN